MASKIRVLPEDVINKIAAGEVIENTASVVKELVENSLDAGATEIIVEILSGGRQMIRISDNGCGMNADDALLCLERHGTSKIRDIDDLFQLSSMGFRGEAVPSIASISKLTLITCPKLEEGKISSEGTMVIVEGGLIQKVSPAIRDIGTTIEVKGLFYNVPVRKKFQKSPAYDVSEILRTISLHALANPFHKFQLISDQKVLLSTARFEGSSFSDAFSERVRNVMGDDYVMDSLSLDVETENYRVKGIIGTPSQHRSNRSGQYLFINHRPVVSQAISYAVKEGFGTMLPSQRFPIFALHIEMPGNFVDVNVHPQKREVRLREEHVIRKIVTESVLGALKPKEEEKTALFSSNVSFSTDDSPPPFQASFSSFSKWRDFNELPGAAWIAQEELSIQEISPPQSVPEKEFSLKISSKNTRRVLMTLPGFIIVDNGGLCFVDQHRAHHRILFEAYTKQQEGLTKKSVESQNLLIPFSLDLGLAEASILSENLDYLSGFGMSIQEFGRNTFLIDAVPHGLEKGDLRETILSLIEELRTSEKGKELREINEKKIVATSLRLALSSKVQLSIPEAQHILNQLLICHNPCFCPLGKLIMKNLNTEEIATQLL